MNSTHFFKLSPAGGPNTWFLARPTDARGNEIDPRRFTEGESIDIPLPIQIDVKKPGNPLDFTFGSFMMPVISAALGNAIAELTGNSVQRLPAYVGGFGEDYEILNIVNVVNAIDWASSEYLVHPGPRVVEHGIPSVKMFGPGRMCVDPSKACDHSIFRLKGWPLPIIVSNDLKKIFESRNVTGVSLHDVTSTGTPGKVWSR